MRRYLRMFVCAVIIAVSTFFMSASALADTGDGAVIVCGVDSSGNMVTENYWNGIAVRSSDGTDCVVVSSLCCDDGDNSSVAAYVAVGDSGNTVLAAAISDGDAKIAILTAGETGKLQTVNISSSTALTSGDPVTVMGIDWEQEGETVADMLGSYDTNITGISQNDAGYAVITLADPAPSAMWESAMILDAGGSVVGILLATEGMDTFLPMDYVMAYLGYDVGSGGDGTSYEGTTGEEPVSTGEPSATSGGNTTATVFTIAIVLVVAALVLAIISYRKKKTILPAEYVAPLGEKPADIPLYISCTGGEFSGMRIPLQEPITIGRSASCRLVYTDEADGISGVHCIVAKKGGTAEITDMGSTYGTFCRGAKLAPNTPVFLHPGESFYLATPENTYVISK